MSFPLLDQLKQDIVVNPPTLDWRRWCPLISSLSEQQTEYIYAIILANDPNTDKPPYGGRSFDSGRGIIFQVSNLPLPIQQLITRYLEWLMPTN